MKRESQRKKVAAIQKITAEMQVSRVHLERADLCRGISRNASTPSRWVLPRLKIMKLGSRKKRMPVRAEIQKLLVFEMSFNNIRI